MTETLRSGYPRSRTWWVVTGLILVSVGAFALGYVLDLGCRMSDWAVGPQFVQLCYSDIPKLYVERGIVEGVVPYLEKAQNTTYLEYPVLSGFLVYIGGAITRAMMGTSTGLDAVARFFDVNVVLLAISFAAAVVATGLTLRRRPWDALMVALAPTVILAGTINWDMLAVGITALAILAWARNRPWLAGVLMGLGISAKFYPLVLLAGFVLLAVRVRAWAPTARLLAGTVLAWLVVNVPLMLLNFEGWSVFYSFSKDRPADYGSPWFALQSVEWMSWDPSTLNTAVTWSLVLGMALVAAAVFTAPVPPRLGSVLFLCIVVFALTNKVYSPQYVLWLVPLAVLARPVWRDFMLWQFAEVWYFLAVWGYIDFLYSGLGWPAWTYAIATFIHIGATLALAAVVVRDIYVPRLDPLRGPDDLRGDPAGGLFLLPRRPDAAPLPVAA